MLPDAQFGIKSLWKHFSRIMCYFKELQSKHYYIWLNWSIVWGEITYPLPNFNGTAVEIWELTSNFISHFIMDAMLCTLGLKFIRVSKRGPCTAIASVLDLLRYTSYSLTTWRVTYVMPTMVVGLQIVTYLPKCMGGGYYVPLNIMKPGIDITMQKLR